MLMDEESKVEGGRTVTLTITRVKKPSDEQVRCRGLTTSMLIKNPKCQPSVSISLAARPSNSNSTAVSSGEEKRWEIKAAIGAINRVTDTSSCPRNF